MAIYNGRIVSIHPEDMASTPPVVVSVTFTDGHVESVPFSKIRFTKEEKADIKKVQADRADGLADLTDQDKEVIKQDKANQPKAEVEKAKVQ